MEQEINNLENVPIAVTWRTDNARASWGWALVEEE